MERLMKLTVIWKIFVSKKTCASLLTAVPINLTILQKVYTLTSEEVVIRRSILQNMFAEVCYR